MVLVAAPAHAVTASPPHVITGALDRGFTRVGRSRIHGTGVFAKRKIPKGSRIIEYTGARVSLDVVVAESTDGLPASAYAFRLNDATIIDGARDGNDARFINHSCEPNCEALSFDDHMYIYALRDIPRGEELTFDYHLSAMTPRRVSKREREAYPCRCGSQGCRGTMLAPRPTQSR